MSADLVPESDSALLRVLRDDGRTDREHDPFLAADTLLAMYREMRRVRLLDTRMVSLQRQGRIGFYGPCTGQEAPPIATAFAIAPRDWVFPALREGAIMLARGFPLAKYVAQVFGTELDVLKGRQMPSHMSGREVNQVAWSSCIGTQLPQAVGSAWAAKIRGDKLVTVGFLGDGATSHSDFHAAMNFAAVFRVPCVLICQNNHWSISVPVSRQTRSATLAVKARAYGLPGVRVDGNDVLAVYRAVSDAVYRARQGEGPTFIECLTYRLGGHSTSDDPSRYRSEQEVSEWAERDPILRFRRHLQYLGLMDDKLDGELEAEIERDITHVRPDGNAEGWGGLQWLYFPDESYNEVRGIVARAITGAACGAV
ncbi:MAG TPA: thiamine pyrophosphate-dependent enzyme, partial [Polyangiaceae bacterium]|nr:thiamine pyrophosphate-dependent enzyme [Polyangiaceae bacterium]